ncbi:unnamed protein product, partial [Timema podura]|nr:unnamed protein product [Timema podura]
MNILYKVQIGTKIFGNEFKYDTFFGSNEIKAALASVDPMTKLQELLSGKTNQTNIRLWRGPQQQQLAAIGNTLTKITNISRVDASLVDVDLEGSTTDLRSGKMVLAPVSPSISESEPSLLARDQITTKSSESELSPSTEDLTSRTSPQSPSFIAQGEFAVTLNRVRSFSPVTVQESKSISNAAQSSRQRTCPKRNPNNLSGDVTNNKLEPGTL